MLPAGGETGHRNMKLSYQLNGAKLGWLIDPKTRE
nr:Uma2 family endonuclease [Aliterella atlantica]